VTHATAARALEAVAAVSGLVTIDQEVPLKSSTRVCSVPREPVAALPTATHIAGESQDTALSSFACSELVFGLASMDQVPLSSRSTRVWELPLDAGVAEPTAMHTEAVGHVTERSTLAAVAEVSGLVTIDHDEPL
jgi:hypothetical protein